MEWIMPDGSRYAAGNGQGIRNAFAVYNPWYAITNFNVFGSVSSAPSLFMNDANGKYWTSTNAWPTMVNGRTYLNGDRVDGSTTDVIYQKKLLVEGAPRMNGTSSADSFFGTGAKATSGGDFMYEAIVFTNDLAEAERLEVETYLIERHSLSSARGARNITVDSGATLAMDTTALAGEKISVSGRGTFAKSGSGVWTNALDSAFEGAFDVRDGTVALLAPAATVAAAGQTVVATNTLGGTVLSAESGTAETFTKKGNDLAIVTEIPADVRTIKVENGTLRFAPPTVALSGTAYEIPIENAGFEDFSDGISDGTKKLTSGSALNGWVLINKGLAYAMDFDQWTGNSTAIGATRNAFDVYSRPPEGSCALVLRGKTGNDGEDVNVRSELFTLSESGAYELTFRYCGRQHEAYLGQKLNVRLYYYPTRETEHIDATGTWLGSVRMTYLGGYQQTKMRLENLDVQSGYYRIEFAAPKTWFVNGGLCMIDDVHLCKVPSDPAAASRWDIPGGNFDEANITVGNATKEFTTDFTLSRWTLSQSGSWTAGKQADVGFATIAATNTAANFGSGVYYNNSREPSCGSVELTFVKTGAKASTTFTPPVGNWVVECDMAKLGSCDYSPSLVATIAKNGGTPAVKGTIAPTSKMMTTYTWPTNFTFKTGQGNVTLTFELVGNHDGEGADMSGIVIDDVRLRSADVYERGDCESLETPPKPRGVNASDIGGSGYARHRNPKKEGSEELDKTNDFGTVLNGDYMYTLEGKSLIYELLYLTPGRYRLSFHAHSRLGDANKAGYPANPVRGWIVKSPDGVDTGVTNELGRVGTYNDVWVKRSFDFDVTEENGYRIALQGCNDNSKGEAHIDGISLDRLGDLDTVGKPPLPRRAVIEVAEGARIEAGFSGTNYVRSISLGGVERSGVVSHETYPAYVSGQGVFFAAPIGLVSVFK
jgi:hypothetical protein